VSGDAGSGAPEGAAGGHSMLRIHVKRAKPLLKAGMLRVKLKRPLTGNRCPLCGSKLYYIRSLDAYYCFNCKYYVY